MSPQAKSNLTTVIGVLAVLVGLSALGVGIAALVKLNNEVGARLDAQSAEGMVRQAQVDAILNRSETTFADLNGGLISFATPGTVELTQTTGTPTPSFMTWAPGVATITAPGTYCAGFQWYENFSGLPQQWAVRVQVVVAPGGAPVPDTVQAGSFQGSATILTLFDVLAKRFVLEPSQLPAQLVFRFESTPSVTVDITAPTYAWVTKLL